MNRMPDSETSPPLDKDVTEVIAVMQVETDEGYYDAYTLRGDNVEERGRVLLGTFRKSAQRRNYRLIKRTTTSRDELLA